MRAPSLLFVLTPYGLTSLALLLLTTAFVIFLAQSHPRSAAGRWMLGHEVSLALFLTAHRLLNSTFLPVWYPVMYGSVVVGMACLLQFAFVFPQPGPDPRLARRMLALSIGSIAITLALLISFWLAPQTDQALALRNAAMVLGLWQCLVVDSTFPVASGLRGSPTGGCAGRAG